VPFPSPVQGFSTHGLTVPHELGEQEAVVAVVDR
jgi:hypothetical protein